MHKQAILNKLKSIMVKKATDSNVESGDLYEKYYPRERPKMSPEELSISSDLGCAGALVPSKYGYADFTGRIAEPYTFGDKRNKLYTWTPNHNGVGTITDMDTKPLSDMDSFMTTLREKYPNSFYVPTYYDTPEEASLFQPVLFDGRDKELYEERRKADPSGNLTISPILTHEPGEPVFSLNDKIPNMYGYVAIDPPSRDNLMNSRTDLLADFIHEHTHAQNMPSFIDYRGHNNFMTDSHTVYPYNEPSALGIAERATTGATNDFLLRNGNYGLPLDYYGPTSYVYNSLPYITEEERAFNRQFAPSNHESGLQPVFTPSDGNTLAASMGYFSPNLKHIDSLSRYLSYQQSLNDYKGPKVPFKKPRYWTGVPVIEALTKRYSDIQPMLDLYLSSQDTAAPEFKSNGDPVIDEAVQKANKVNGVPQYDPDDATFSRYIKAYENYPRFLVDNAARYGGFSEFERTDDVNRDPAAYSRKHKEMQEFLRDYTKPLPGKELVRTPEVNSILRPWQIDPRTDFRLYPDNNQGFFEQYDYAPNNMSYRQMDILRNQLESSQKSWNDAQKPNEYNPHFPNNA